MTTPIYLPPSGKGFGGALGEGMSAGIMKGLERREKEEKARRVGKMFDDLSNSSDRKQAMEKAGIMVTQMADDIEDVNAVYAQVDRLFPAKDETPVEVTAIGPDNKPTSRFLPRGQTPILNTPEGVEEVFGPNYRLGSKPEDELEFLRPGATPEEVPQSLGKFPISQRPEGSITVDEHTLARQMLTDRRSAEAARLAGERDERSQRYLQLAEDRAARLERDKTKTAGATAAAQSADDFRQDLSKVEGAVIKGLGKQLEDGTWSFVGENERKLFYQRADYASTLLEQAYRKGGSKNYIAIARQAVDKFPGAADLPQQPAAEIPKPPEKPGIVSRAYGAVKDKLFGKDKPKDKALESALKSAGWKYEPEKYDYRVVDGKPQRKLKGKK